MNSIADARKNLKKSSGNGTKKASKRPSLTLSPSKKKGSFRVNKMTNKEGDKPLTAVSSKLKHNPFLTGATLKKKPSTPSPVHKRKSLLKTKGMVIAPALPVASKINASVAPSGSKWNSSSKHSTETKKDSFLKIKTKNKDSETTNAPVRFETTSANEPHPTLDPLLVRLRKAQVLADIETTPRDNNLVTALTQITCGRSTVATMDCQADPRWDHLSPTLLLDCADALRYNVYLTTLSLTHVQLGNAFLTSLASSIPHNYTLQTLNLQDNQFTSEALVEFVCALPDNKSLSIVQLQRQHSPIFTHDEKRALQALTDNTYVRTLELEFLNPKSQTFVQTLLERNRKKQKQLDENKRVKKWKEWLEAEVQVAEAEYKTQQTLEQEHQNSEVSNELTLDDSDDIDYFHELETIAKQHKVDLNSTSDGVFSQKSNSMFSFVSGGTNSSSLQKTLDFPSTRMSADGKFLDDAFVDTYLQSDGSLLTFEFTNQFKLFKRFGTDDPARSTIATRFVQALLDHPKQDQINSLQLANSCIADDVLKQLCEQSKQQKKLQNLHQLNLETNFLSDKGLLALANNLQRPMQKSKGKKTKANEYIHWKFLQCVKLDNQKSPIKTAAEVALAQALWVNRTVIRLSLRVRNLRERERIAQCIQRNIDFLRQARQLHRQKTGTLKARARNKMEQYFDQIANNDSSVTQVNIVGDQLFLALSKAETLKTGQAFATNTYVTEVKLSLLKLNDEWAEQFARCLGKNTTIETINLDNNSIGSMGITAIVEALSGNTSVMELQVRHQSKPVSSADEETLAGLLTTNTTLVKFGIDLRSTRARNEVDRKIRQNQELRRKQQRSTPTKTKCCSADSSLSSTPERAAETPSRSSSTKSKIKSNETAKLLKQVKANDSSLEKIKLDECAEFIELSMTQKKEFLQDLAKNTHVQTLKLNSCELDNFFAEELASCLKTNKTLNTISLNGNQFTSPGILSIAQAGKKRVKKLSILKPRFQMTDADAELLIEALESKCKYKKLDIEFRSEILQTKLKKLLRE